MSIKAHIALGTLLGVLLGVGAVAVLSRTATPADSSAEATERDAGADDSNAVSPAAVSELGSASATRRPMRPGSQRRLLQS